MKKTIIISLDALGETDAKYYEKLDGFKYLIDKGAYIKNMETVYPSLTYPCHASIITGRYPKDHKVVNNLILQPSKENKDWYWYEKDIHGDTIFRVAKRKGLRIGAILWPVLAKGNIDWNIAEIMPHGLYFNQPIVSLANSSPGVLLEMEKRYGAKRDGLKQPQLDNYVEGCLHDFILEGNLDIIAAHFTAVDSKKHEYGTDNEEVIKAIKAYNDRIISLLSLLDENNIEANIFFISDHSQLDVYTGIKLNSFFNELGYLTIKDNKIFKYKYYMQEAGGSCYIYGRKNTAEDDKTLRGQLEELNDRYGFFDYIFTSKEAKDLAADPSCVFMIEAKRGYSFINGHEGELLQEKPKGQRATHGYIANKENYSPVLFALGPDIKNITLEKGRLIDVGPTISRLMDLDLQGASGHPLDILEERSLYETI